MILKFLGGNWKQWMIQEALEILKDEALDKDTAYMQKLWSDHWDKVPDSIKFRRFSVKILLFSPKLGSFLLI